MPCVKVTDITNTMGFMLTEFTLEIFVYLGSAQNAVGVRKEVKKLFFAVFEGLSIRQRKKSIYRQHIPGLDELSFPKF